MDSQPLSVPDSAEIVLHASSVVVADCGIAILGPSGSGKSALALELMALGAGLIADDRTLVRRQGDVLLLEAPKTLPPRIEARGIGLLPVLPAGSARLRLVVDLSRNSYERLPHPRSRCILGQEIKLIHRSQDCPMAAAVLQLARGTTDWTCD
ncbi:MAG: HPr kinase/phosphorylase [Qingshengfaniella sp.]